jgi:hypothetical protein
MSETTMLPARTAWYRLDYLPVSFFGAVMGLTGLSIAWRLAYENFGMPGWIAVSALRFAASRPGWPDLLLARGLLFLATIVIISLLMRTNLGVVHGKLTALSG